MKSFRRIGLFLPAAIIVFCPVLHAEPRYNVDHAVALNYVSGAVDVVDFYDRIPGMEKESGAAVGGSYNMYLTYDNGLMFGPGVGPITWIDGDIDYYDLPVKVVAGFALPVSSMVRPYIKAGVSYHINDGDYIKDEADFGFIGALGCEIGKKGRISGFVEVSHDTAEATFEINNFLGFYSDREDIKVNKTMLTGGVVF